MFSHYVIVAGISLTLPSVSSAAVCLSGSSSEVDLSASLTASQPSELQLSSESSSEGFLVPLGSCFVWYYSYQRYLSLAIHTHDEIHAACFLKFVFSCHILIIEFSTGTVVAYLFPCIFSDKGRAVQLQAAEIYFFVFLRLY